MIFFLFVINYGFFFVFFWQFFVCFRFLFFFFCAPLIRTCFINCFSLHICFETEKHRETRRTVAIQTRSVIGERNNRSLVRNNG